MHRRTAVLAALVAIYMITRFARAAGYSARQGAQTEHQVFISITLISIFVCAHLITRVFFDGDDTGPEKS